MAETFILKLINREIRRNTIAELYAAGLYKAYIMENRLFRYPEAGQHVAHHSSG